MHSEGKLVLKDAFYTTYDEAYHYPSPMQPPVNIRQAANEQPARLSTHPLVLTGFATPNGPSPHLRKLESSSSWC